MKRPMLEWIRNVREKLQNVSSEPSALSDADSEPLENLEAAEVIHKHFHRHQLIAELVRLRARFAHVGMMKTFHALEEAVRSSGWELAEIIEGTHPMVRENDPERGAARSSQPG